MPIDPLFAAKPVVDDDDLHAMIERHAAKINNLRITLLDFLFDFELMRDYMKMDCIAIKTSLRSLQDKMMQKYGSVPYDVQCSDEYIEKLDKSLAESIQLRDTDKIIYSPGLQICAIREGIEHLLPIVTDMAMLQDMSRGLTVRQTFRDKR